MENSEKFLKDNNILPRISFKDGQSHTVTLIKDKIDSIKDEKGVEKQGVKYMVTENGEPKTFFTSSVGLIQKLAECPENTEVNIQMKSKKGSNGFISYFTVSKVGEAQQEPSSEDYESIPDFPEQV